MPPPDQVLTEAFGDSGVRERLWEGLLATSYLSMVGLLVAIVLGIFLAVLMSVSQMAERAVFPWAVALQVVPIFALIPVIDLWFQNVDTWFLGFDQHFKKRLMVCVLIALFPIITNTHFGLKSVEPHLHDLFTLHHSNRFIRLFKLEFKAATPAIFVGFRIAAGLSVIGAIVAEFLFRRGPRGIGTLIDLYRGQALYPQLIATILVSSFLGILVYWGFTLAGNTLTRHWHASAQEIPA